MQKVTSTGSNNINVTMSRFGSNPITLTMPEGSTVAQVLVAAGISTQSHERLFVTGITAEMGDILENNDVLSIVTPKQAGAR